MKERETSDQPAQESRCLLLATANRDKLEELQALFTDLPFRLVSPADIGLTLEVEETGQTFRENAELKAKAYAKAAGLLALADDSGLEIDALGGAPGVYSARFLGRDTPYEERFRVILQRLQGLPPERRTARFRCCIAIAEPWGYCRTVDGVIEGQIAEEPRGSNGFGYDPIFLVPELGKTTAELSPEEKHRISHRGRAAQLARRLLASWPPFATSADLLDSLP
ncbi:MAG: RdgB/HAM1 family non-canonical purine NTP pyrophosphatase [Thermogemmatispora sp.]|uniref:RdgB/HAM1 family non-canonical purine NTP pyrophosphatase n=3 Tax=Thermogemmatispora sp. TaxID=1968838 RepID=UPI001D46C229|nr:RdgB/HAM1 family non-canonical purine NTP pyrophosphatase [Thermogemmatispora sp.]MBX5451195.1 RdgB/HAM1 family non-canonical purine NTP pyrophosphatase [Thermogemmatispora sp.]